MRNWMGVMRRGLSYRDRGQREVEQHGTRNEDIEELIETRKPPTVPRSCRPHSHFGDSAMWCCGVHVGRRNKIYAEANEDACGERKPSA
jgi:hypothetical protein